MSNLFLGEFRIFRMSSPLAHHLTIIMESPYEEQLDYEFSSFEGLDEVAKTPKPTRWGNGIVRKWEGNTSMSDLNIILEQFDLYIFMGISLYSLSEDNMIGSLEIKPVAITSMFKMFG